MSRLFLILLAITILQISSSFGEKDFIEQRELSTRHASVTGIASKQRDKRAIGLFLIMAHGVLSAGFDIYKYTYGCTHFEGFEDAIKELDKLQTRLRNLEDEINLAWVPFQSKESLFQRLVANLNILNAHVTTLLDYEEDIIRLMDQDVIEKLAETTEELKEKIDANDLDNLQSINDLTKKYMSDLRFAYRTISNLQPLASYLLPKVTAKIGVLFAGRSASNFASANPSRMRKIINYATAKKAAVERWATTQKDRLKQLVTNFKMSLKNSVRNFIARHPKLNRVFNHLTQSPRAQARWKTAGKALKVSAKAFIYGGAFVYDVYLGVKFVKECQKRRDNAQFLVRNFTAQVQIMEDMKDNITELTKSIDENYALIKKDITGEEFTSFLDSMTTLVKDEANNDDDIKTALSDIASYKKDIEKADALNSDRMIQKLISATTVINNFLQCSFSRIKIVRQAIDDCGAARGSMEQIYNHASLASQNLIKDCPHVKNFNKNSFLKAVSKQLTKTEKKSDKCELNSKDKLDLVCALWYSGRVNTYITSVTSIDDNDLEIVKKNCPKNEINTTVRLGICYRKENNEVLSDIIKTYFQYDETEIKDIYMECMGDATKNTICMLKGSNIATDHVIFSAPMFTNYSKLKIEQVYAEC